MISTNSKITFEYAGMIWNCEVFSWAVNNEIIYTIKPLPSAEVQDFIIFNELRVPFVLKRSSAGTLHFDDAESSEDFEELETLLSNVITEKMPM